MATNLSGYGGDDPNLRLGKRIKLLSQAFPEYANDVQLLTKLAKTDLEDGELLRQTGDASGLQAFSKTKETLEAQSLKAQREIFRKLPAITQASLMKIGYEVPRFDYNESSLKVFGVDLGWKKREGVLGAIANAVQTPAALGAYGVHTLRELGGGIIDLQNAGSEVVQRGYRAASALTGGLNVPMATQAAVIPGLSREQVAGETVGNLGLGGRVVRTAEENQQIRQSRTAEAAYWLQQNVANGTLSQVDAQRIASKGPEAVLKWYENVNDKDLLKGMDRLRAYSGSWGDAWSGTKKANGSFRAQEVLQAQANLDFDFGKINIAERVAMGDTAEEMLAERGIVIGTNEYRAELSKLQEEINDEKVQQSIALLKSSTISFGTDYARSQGLKEGTVPFSIVSGVAEVGFLIGTDPTLPAGAAIKGIRAARYGVNAADVSGEISRIRNVIAAGDSHYLNPDGTRKFGISLLAARDEMVRAQSVHRAVTSVVNAWNEGGRSFYQLLTEQPQLAPLIGFARKAVAVGDDGTITADRLYDALQTDAGIATILQGSPRMYRRVAGQAALPRVDLYNQASGVIRGSLARGTDILVDYKIGKQAVSSAAIAKKMGTQGLFAQNLAYTAGKFERALAYVPTTIAQVARLGLKVPYRSYVNLEDMGSIKEMLNLGSLVGIDSAAQAKALDEIIRGVDTANGIADRATSLAAARSVVASYLSGMLNSLGIPDLAKNTDDLGGLANFGMERRRKWANDLMKTFGEAYDVKGDQLAYLAAHASPNIRIPGVAQLARAAQNNMFLAGMYRFMNPWWLESVTMRWRQLVTIAPRMGLRAGVEEGLSFLLREGPGRYSQALRASSIYAPERVKTLETLAAKAFNEGNIARQQALLDEAENLRRMPGLRAMAGGIDYLASKISGTPVLGTAVNAMARFTDAVTASVTDYYRRALGAIAPISDSQIRLGAELWARDESAMALASVIDGRHTVIESPTLDPFKSAAEIVDGSNAPLDVSMTGGRGFRLLATRTDDMFQNLNRMAQMTQHARDPFVQEAMRRIAGAHTQLERNVIRGAFSSPEKGKQYQQVFRIPDDIPDDEKFDWAMTRFREAVEELHPSVRDDVVKALRSRYKDPGSVQELEEAQALAEEAGNFQLSQEIGRRLANLRAGGGSQQVTLGLKTRKTMIDSRAALDNYKQAYDDLEWIRTKATKKAQASLKAAINARNPALASTKATKAMAARVVGDLNSGSPAKATLDFVGAINRRPNARKAINKAFDEWSTWDQSITNFDAMQQLTRGLDLRFVELLTYDGPLTRISGEGPEALRSWFQTEVLTSAAKDGLYNNQELAANMDRMLRVPYTDSQGRQFIGTVARPLPENRVGIYWPTVDDGVANSLYATLTQVDNLVAQGMERNDAIASIIDNMAFMKSDGSFDVASSRQRYIMSKVLENTNRDGVWAYMQEAKTSGRGLLPFSNITYASHDMADEVNRVLHAGLGAKWIDEGKANLGIVDIVTPKGVIQHPDWKPGSLLNVNFIPADSEVGTLPTRIGNSLVYATPDHILYRGQPLTPASKVTLPDGTVVAGFSREQAFDAFAAQIAQATIDRFTSPTTGGILHDVIHGILRDEDDLYQRVANLNIEDLPEQSIVPNIYIVMKEAEGARGFSATLNKLAEIGYNKAVSPLIAGISRQPLFISALGEAATVARDWRKSVIALSAKEQGVAAMFAARGVSYEDVLKAWDALGPYDTRPNVPLKKLMSVFADNGVTLADEVEAKDVRDALSYLTHIDRMERNIAYERAFNNILPYIDDHNIKTFASTYMRGMVPFLYAEEQFMRRWLRTLIDNPFALHRAQMYLGAMRTVGIVHKDERDGQYYFTYPFIPAIADFFGKFPVIGDVFFGGSGRLPNGIDLNAAVSESLPGFKNPGQIMPGPMFTVAMGAVRHFGGQSELVADDMIESVTGRRPNPKTFGSDVLLGLLPGYASRFVKAHFDSVDSGEELARTSIQAAMMFGAEGQAYKRKALDAKAKGDLETYNRLLAKANPLLPPEDTEDKEAMEDYRTRIQQAARKMMFMRGITGFAGFGTSYLQGEQYEMTEKFNDYLKAIDPTDPDGYAKAVGKYLARYPDALPYTVKGTVSASKAPVPMTTGTGLWLREHAAIVKSDPLGASWLVPPDVEGERDPRVWGRLKALEIYKQRDMKEWAVSYHMAASGRSFYANKDKFDLAIAENENNPEAKRALKARWSEWRAAFMKANVVFDREMSSDSGRKRREQILTEINRIVESGAAPQDEYAQNIIRLAMNYAKYRDAKANIIGGSKAAQEQRYALQLAFWKYGVNAMNTDIALAGFWDSVIAPDAFTESFNPYGSN